MNSKTYTIPHDNYEETNAALGLTIKRTDGVWLRSKVWFPKSQLNIVRIGTNIRVDIPEWLLKSKVNDGFRIVEYW